MQHDIYSLGVVLLELGLWTSFITYPSSCPSTSLPPNSDLHVMEDKEKEAINSIALKNPDTDTAIPPPFVDSQSFEKHPRKRAAAIQSHFIHLAIEMLPAAMGEKYTQIVLLCLRCLDKSGTDGDKVESGEFSDVYDEDGIEVGVKYIEKILLQMQEISV